MISSIFEKDTQKLVLFRLNKIQAQTKPAWGKFNSRDMLTHLTDSLKMALGKIETKPKKTILIFWPIKMLFIYIIPIPKGIPTAPELISRTGESFEKEKLNFISLLSEFTDRRKDRNWPRHPTFGKLKKSNWDRLTYNHIDHHFRQFGV